MRKIINAPERFVDEVLEGILEAHSDRLRTAPGASRGVITMSSTRPGRVAIASGGGSGHLPLFLGYVGDGLLNGVAVGNVFSSPSADDILAVTRAIDGGGGVLYLYGNYGGDVFNFDSAASRAIEEGIPVATVLGTDDIASAELSNSATRRGVAGLVLAFKTAGAAARRGMSLADVTGIARRTVEGTRTMGVGLSPTILPEAGAATFELDDGEMEVGVGIHGEPGSYRGPLESADAIADRFVDTLLTEVSNDRVAVLVNGLGATPLEELYLLYRRVFLRLQERGITIVHRYVGEYATSLEMAGASVSLCALDPELESLLDEPVEAAFFAPWASAPWASAPSASRMTNDPVIGVAAKPRVVDHDSVKVMGSGQDAGLGTEIAERIVRAMPLWAAAEEELRDLDAAIGDGDLGITVSRGSAAVIKAIEALSAPRYPAAVIEAAASAFGRANPSTFAALASLGGAAFAQHLRSSPADWSGATRSAFDSICARAGAQLGDKTLLDPLDAIARALASNEDDLVSAASTAAAEVTGRLASQRSVRGRAAWTGERSEGHRDPGSVALVRLIESFRDARHPDALSGT